MPSSSSKQALPGIRRLLMRLLPIAFIVIGTVTAFFGLRGILRAGQSLDWPASQSVITESSVEHIRRSVNGRIMKTYHPEILYTYTVDGTDYIGDRIAYGDYSSSNPSRAQSIVTRYPEGKNVAVYHVPGNPEESLLEPGIKGESFMLLGFRLVFVVTGGVVTV